MYLTYIRFVERALRHHHCFVHSDRRLVRIGGIRSALLTTNAPSFRSVIKVVVVNWLIINVLHNAGSRNERPEFCN